MENSVIVKGAILIAMAGVLGIGIVWLIYRKSIMKKIGFLFTFPIVIVAILAFIVGAKGISHLAWAVPVAFIAIFGMYIFISGIIGKPLKEMQKNVDSLAKGDVNINFKEKYLKGNDEIAKVVQLLQTFTHSLQKTVDFANHVGKGDMNVDYQLLSDEDALGKAMLDMRNNLMEADREIAKRREEDEQRSWVAAGQAKFAEILRSNNDNLEELSYQIISNLVKYTNSNQAAIFILNDEDPSHPYLEMTASYAYERRKFADKTIEIGEGTVGTCYVERQSIYMTDVPKDYIKITSGLGEDIPSAIFIVPVKINEEIYGVLEIAAFETYPGYVREFIEKIAENMASTVGAVKVNVRTNRLLELSKIQAEEMRNQEEELRQNLEELHATQEEMGKRQGETEQARRELESDNRRFYEKFTGMEQAVPAVVLSGELKITEANNIFLDVFQMKKKQLVKKSFSEIFVSEDENIGNKLLKIIDENTSESGKIGIPVSEDGEKAWFYATLMPGQDKPKILFFCSPLRTG